MMIRLLKVSIICLILMIVAITWSCIDYCIYQIKQEKVSFTPKSAKQIKPTGGKYGD